MATVNFLLFRTLPRVLTFFFFFFCILTFLRMRTSLAWLLPSLFPLPEFSLIFLKQKVNICWRFYIFCTITFLDMKQETVSKSWLIDEDSSTKALKCIQLSKALCKHVTSRKYYSFCCSAWCISKRRNHSSVCSVIFCMQLTNKFSGLIKKSALNKLIHVQFPSSLSPHTSCIGEIPLHARGKQVVGNFVWRAKPTSVRALCYRCVLTSVPTNVSTPPNILYEQSAAGKREWYEPTIGKILIICVKYTALTCVYLLW